MCGLQLAWPSLQLGWKTRPFSSLCSTNTKFLSENHDTDSFTLKFDYFMHINFFLMCCATPSDSARSPKIKTCWQLHQQLSSSLSLPLIKALVISRMLECKRKTEQPIYKQAIVVIVHTRSNRATSAFLLFEWQLHTYPPQSC